MEIAREISSNYAARSSGYATMRNFANTYSALTGSRCESRRTDNPYSTQVSLVATEIALTDFPIGKYSFGNPETGRYRVGYAFSVPSGLNVAAARIRVLNTGFIANVAEFFSPQIYISDTDDFALYSTTSTKAAWNWETKLNYLAAQMNYGDQSQQVFNIPVDKVISKRGAHLCFIIGTSVELANAGSGPFFAFFKSTMFLEVQ